MEYYNTLGLPKHASQDDIKKAYRKLAMTHHPDKGGDSGKFKEISEAFETLSDEEKRKHYDSHGKQRADFRPQHRESHNPHDIFGAFFNGRQQQSRKQSKVHDFAMSLEDVYSGKTVKINVNHAVKCKDCGGTGSTKPPERCDECNGAGMVMFRVRMGDGMETVLRQPCRSCAGKGKVHDASNGCRTCKFSGSTRETEKVEFYVPPGSPDGKHITIAGMGEYDFQTGFTDSLTIKLKYKLDPNRLPIANGDIEITKQIPLYEALCGGNFVYTHLDGKQHLINMKKIINNGCKYRVKELGMKKESYLIINFSIVFPLTLIEESASLAGILGYTTHPNTEPARSIEREHRI